MNHEPPDVPGIADRRMKTQVLHQRADGRWLTELVALYGEGRVPLPQIEILPREDAAEAQRRSESGRTRGKLVLAVRDMD